MGCRIVDGWWWLIAGLLCAGLVCGSAATVITAQPAEVQSGDLVMVTIRDLPEGASFSFLLEGSLVPSQVGYQFYASQFTMPLTLEEGELSAYAENVLWTRLSVKKGNTTVSVRSDPVDGVFRLSQEYAISSGVYDHLRIEGDRKNESQPVPCRLQLTGRKRGPDTSQITFTLGGVESGSVTVIAYVNGSVAMNQQLRVVPRTPGGGDEGSSGGILPALTTVTPLPTISPPPTVTRGGELSTFTSVDGRIELTAPAEDLHILPTGNVSIPPGWELAAPPFMVLPETVIFDPSGVLSVSLGDVLTDRPLFLSVHEGNEWRMLHSRIEGKRISADIHHGGVYALMTLLSDSGTARMNVTEYARKGTESAHGAWPLAAETWILGPVLLFFVLFRLGRRS